MAIAALPHPRQAPDAHCPVGVPPASEMPFKQTAEATTVVMASAGVVGAVWFGSGRARLGVEDGRHEFWFDGLLLAAGRLAEGERSQAVEVAVGAGAVLVEQRDRACGEEFLGAAREREPVAEIVG